MSAPRPAGPAPARLSGPQRAAALLMLLGEEHGGAIWTELTDGEVRTVCTAMAELGAVPGEVLDEIMTAFAAGLESTGALAGSAERAEQLLAGVFPPERVAAVMADVRGKSGRQVWRRMSHVPADILSRFLRNESPQTVAVVLSRIAPDHGGRVLALLPDALATDVVGRMLRLGPVRPEALDDIEDMLFDEFLRSGPQKPEPDRFELMADRFNSFDRQTETRFLAALEERDEEAAQRIRQKMFTFDDLLKLDAAGAQTLLRHADKTLLARALKAASDDARAFFQSNMSTRAAKNLQDDMEAMGAIRKKDAEDAQAELVRLTKELADKGEIRIQKNAADDEVVL